MTKKQWGHDELAHDLAQSLRVNPGHIVWENMQMGPSGSIRPDVYLLKKRYSEFAPVTYEVKVSVSDFRSDITSGKWQGYLQFSSAVIFAVPAGLISKDDIPSGCGLIVRHDEVWRTIKRPTVQRIDTLPRASWMKLVIDGIERAVEQRDTPRLRAAPRSWSVEQLLRKKVGNEIATLVAMALRSQEDIVDELKRREKQREEIRDGTSQELKWARESAARDQANLSSELSGLAQALGLPPTATPSEMTTALSSAVRRLAEDAELNRLRRTLDNIKQAFERGLEPLPGENDNQPSAAGALEHHA